jgi:glycosyltransferase involved in cell wall biosynthesis
MTAPAPPQRVVYVVSLFPCWSETFIVREISALIESGIDVRVLSLKPATEQMVHEDAAALLDRVRHPATVASAVVASLRVAARRPLVLAGIVARIVADTWKGPRVLLKSLAALLRGLEHEAWLRQFDPDLIHAHWATYPSTVAWALGRLLDKPFGFTCHAHDIFTERQLLARKLDEAAVAVTISRYNVDWLSANVAGDGARRLKVVHCGVDLAHAPWQPDHRKDDQLLAVGRLDPIKGFDTLISALSLLQKRGVGFNCRLVGSGPLEADLREQARCMGVSEQIEFAGAQPQQVVRRWMDEAALFVLPSQVASDGNRDGIPVALMEAMASGCVTVSTRVSGIPELIEDHVSGLLVDAKDPAALADALQRLLEDASLRRELAASARERVEQQFDSRIEAARLRGHMQEALHVA